MIQRGRDDKLPIQWKRGRAEESCVKLADSQLRALDCHKTDIIVSLLVSLTPLSFKQTYAFLSRPSSSSNSLHCTTQRDRKFVWEEEAVFIENRGNPSCSIALFHTCNATSVHTHTRRDNYADNERDEGWSELVLIMAQWHRVLMILLLLCWLDRKP